MKFPKSRLGMFMVFSVFLAGSVLLTLIFKYKRNAITQSRSTSVTGSSIVAQPEVYSPDKGKRKDREQKEEPGHTTTTIPPTTSSPEKESINRVKQNVPVAAIQGGRIARLQDYNTSASTEVIQRQASQLETPGTQSTQQFNSAQQKQHPGPMMMVSFTRRKTAEGQSVVAPKSEKNSMAAKDESKARISKHFLPYGRAIKAELVNALVASTRSESPVVGLVDEDVKDWATNEVVIPAGAELHGMSRPDKQLERLFTADQWVLVLPKSFEPMPGAEIRITGIAMDRDEKILENGARAFGPYDMSPGIVGEVVRTDADIKLFLADALSGFAKTAQTKDTSQTLLGTSETVKSTTKNALLGAASSTADRYADLALDEYKNNGWFMRVKSAKQFYLYVQQTLDMENAKIGFTQDVAQNKGITDKLEKLKSP